MDTKPLAGSMNPITSDAVHVAIGEVEITVSAKLDKTGGTMTGPLELAGDPTEDLEPATKKYVDELFGDLSSALEALL